MKKQLVVQTALGLKILATTRQVPICFVLCPIGISYPTLKNMDMSQVKIKFRLKSFKPKLILNFLCVS